MADNIIYSARLKRSDEEIATTTTTGWNGELNLGYTSVEIGKIVDVAGAASDRNITSVPSPLAQMHIYDDAFDYVHSVRNDATKNRDTIYHKLVSYCLDVWEIMFTYTQHEGLDFTYWDKVQAVLNLQNAGDPAHRLLGNTLNLYLNQDSNPRVQAMSGIHLISYNGNVFAGTSPFTGFFVTPNSLNIPLKNSDNVPFFQIDIPLNKRRKEFQFFMVRFLKAYQTESVFLFKNLYTYVIENLKKSPYYSEINMQVLSAVYTSASFATDYSTPIKSHAGATLNLNYNYGAGVLNLNMPTFELKVDNNCGLLIVPTKPFNGNKIDLPLVLKTNVTGVYMSGQPLQPGYAIPTDVADGNGNIIPLDKRLLPIHNIKHPYVVAGDFIEEYLIELDYKINDDSFITGIKQNFGDKIDNKFQYLLPIKSLYFEYFSYEDLMKNLTIEKTTYYIRVELKVPVSNGQTIALERTFKRFDNYIPNYSQIHRSDLEEGGTAGQGAIISAHVGLTLFPNLKVKPATGTLSEFNDFYKIGVVSAPRTANIKDITFLKESESVSVTPDSPTRIVPTHTQRYEKNEAVIKFLSLGGNGAVSEFDYMQLQFDNAGINTISAIIYPKWLRKSVGSTQFEVAVDFGTSNSYVAYRHNGGQPRSFDILQEDMQLIRLDKASSEDGLTITQRFENKVGHGGTAITTLLTEVQQQFEVPSLMGIDGDRFGYKMPFTTAVSAAEGAGSHLDITSASANIPFALGKYAQMEDLIDIFTNIKWSNIQPDSVEEARLKVFMKQLLYMIRGKVLINGGDPKTTTFRWFKPLSMSVFQSGQFSNLWSALLQEIFHSSVSPMMITESEAPYYLHDAEGKLDGNNPVLSIDIGGGTTDVLVFHRNQPLFANSSFMASQVMFGNFRATTHTRSNPILTYYKSYMGTKIEQYISSSHVEDKAAGHQMKNIHEWYWDANSNARSEDIIGFYFSRPELRFNSVLADPSSPFKISFLLYFAAIHYNSAKFLKECNLPAPRHICMSGNGSRMMGIIDATANAANSPFAKFISEIYRNVMGEDFTHTIQIHTTLNPKEATSQGGLYKDKNFRNAFAEVKVLPGENLFDKDGNLYTNQILYGDFKENKLTFKPEKSEFMKLIELFTGHLNEKFHYNETFGIRADLKEVKKLLTDLGTIEADYEAGLLRRLQMSGDDERLAETVFFYAVAGAIERLSRYMADKAANDN